MNSVLAMYSLTTYFLVYTLKKNNRILCNENAKDYWTPVSIIMLTRYDIHCIHFGLPKTGLCLLLMQTFVKQRCDLHFPSKIFSSSAKEYFLPKIILPNIQSESNNWSWYLVSLSKKFICCTICEKQIICISIICG